MEIQQDVLSGKKKDSLSNHSASRFSQAQFLSPDAAFPPPFRWIFYLAKLVYKIKKDNKTKSQIDEEQSDVTTNITSDEKAKKNRQRTVKIQSNLNTKKAEAANVRGNKKKYFLCLKEVIQVKQQKDRDHTIDGNLSIFKKDLLEEFGRFVNNNDKN